jgi:hypothetical protein
MNDEHPSPAPGVPGADADELASAYLDDELGLDERARAEADSAVMDRAAAFGRIAEQLGASVTVAGDRREVMLGRALAAFDAAVARGDAAVAESPEDQSAADRASEAAVVPLDSRRRARRAWRVLVPVAAAAAAVGAIAFVARDGDGDDGTAADVPAAVSVAAEADAEELATVAAEESAAPAGGGLEAPVEDVGSAAPTPEGGAEAPAQGADAGTAAAEVETTAATADTGEPIPALAAAFGSVPELGAAATPTEVSGLLTDAPRRAAEPDNVAAVHAALADCAGLAGVPVAGVSYRGERTLLVPLDELNYVVVALDCRIVAEVTVSP